MSAQIHQTAIIGKNVKLGNGVVVGPYCVLDGEDIEIESGTWLKSHVVISGRVKIGKNNKIFSFASIGSEPQDKKYKGEETWVKIGDENTIRESVTINLGTHYEDMTTSIGNRNLLMSMSHIAHDCKLGDDIVVSNGSQIAGHVKVCDGAIIGGMSGVLQFSVIGKYAMIGGMSSIRGHVLPFAIFKESSIFGINLIGLRRKGFSNKSIFKISEIFEKIAKKNENLIDIVSEIEKSEDENILEIANFIKSLPENNKLKISDFNI